MSSLMSAADKSTLKYIGIGLTVIVGGGVATYAFLHYRQSQPCRPPAPGSDEELLRQVLELKQEVVVLKNNLSNAVTELRKELGGIQSLVGQKRTRRSRSTHTTWSSTSNRTAGSYQTAYSDYDDDFSDDEFDIALDHLENNINGNANQPAPGSKEELDAICAKVDALYDGSEEDQEEAMRILQDNELNVNHKNSWQLLWRLSRSHVGAYDIRTAYDERCLHATTAVEHSKQALELFEESADVHKWYVISLGANTDFVGTKEKIEIGYELKEHIDRALELAPDDPTLYFMKGRWCWGVYMLTWIERKLAATLFATPPSATVQDALEAFNKAEEIQPGFYKSNQYYIAKCYYEVSDYSSARRWLESALQLPCNNKDDRDAHRDSSELLAKL
uniref:Regulator of microtubule dynamics protein 3 n=1 Tax=Phallusia mammillata TaxID=59560 RepID=A0A6F9DD61_9ASCI|nr:regulator of microtubule dynamics protein 3 [Phallusia mammillata]